MSQKPQPERDKRDQEIASLEAKLDRAYLFIEQLRQQNAKLQGRVTYLENHHNPQSTPRGTTIPRARSSNRQQRRKQGSTISRRRISKGRSAKVSRQQVAAIAIALTALLTIAGLAVRSSNARHSEQSSTIWSQLFHLPSASRVLPPGAKAASLAISSPQPGRENPELVYNVTTPPNFKQSEKLQAIVDELVSLASEKELPTKQLSITLIDTKTGEIAGYQQDILRYPASVVKMFWMVVIYADIENSILENEGDLNVNITKMIKNSDNDAASFIVDKITNTKSQARIEDEEFKNWLNKRQYINRFFQPAGYENININQKAFPVYSINFPEPMGTDLQMRNVPQNPIRNQITTNHAARLLYEICVSKEAVSAAASEKMCELLKRDLSSEVWKKETGNFNPIQGLLGEGLTDTDVNFYSKAGGTSTDRLDAAFVATKDDKTAYILAVFGNDSAYAEDSDIFPNMSRLVFDRMSDRSSSP